jgi:hypothetical protein
MSPRSGKLPFLGSQDEFLDHNGLTRGLSESTRREGELMDKLYTILVDHHKTYDIQEKGKYGLTITLAGVSIGTALPKELFSDAELRRALNRLGYESEGITDILEALTANNVSWKQTRDFNESAVAALGF